MLAPPWLWGCADREQHVRPARAEEHAGEVARAAWSRQPLYRRYLTAGLDIEAILPLCSAASVQFGTLFP